MPEIFIDGKPYSYEGKPMLLQFALDHGVEIPYFCYHPAMSIPTNCRMCLVDVGMPVKDKATGAPVLEEDGSPKIAWGRKPVTACNQGLSPEMAVRTGRTSAVIEKAQKGVLEFLLINHPLDCPICDQAGECPLQIWTYKYGPEGSRFEVNKVHKPKHVELGPRVTLDAERCINCTRCTRFTAEISHSHQLSIQARGDKNFPATAPGKIFDDAYSMNVVDICPVGALTSTDFRFKARVWEMNYTPSICTGCANGCSTDAWLRDNLVLRQTPRHNAQVNNYWMCDEGRLGYARYNEKRVSGVKTRGDVPVEFEAGLSQAVNLLQLHKGKTLFLGSAFASVENNYALQQLAHRMGNAAVQYVPHDQPGWGDNFLRKDDRTPNRAGCELLGLKATSIEKLKADILAGNYGLIYLMEDDHLAQDLQELLATLPCIVHAHQYFAGHEQAAVVLPAATSLEGHGIFINATNVVQLTQMAKQIRRMTPEMWMAMPKSRLDAGGVPVDNWRNTENIVDCLPSWLLISKLTMELGLGWGYADYRPLLAALQEEYPTLAGLRLRIHGRKETFKQSQFDFAVNYILGSPVPAVQQQHLLK